MKALLNWSYKLSAAGAIISLVAMIGSVVIQVFARFFLKSAPPWTEEMARVFFIYAVAFGAGIGVRDGAFVRLDLLRNFAGEKRYALIQGGIHLCVAAFAVLLVGHSWAFVSIGFEEKSPALEMNMGYVFASMTIMLLSLVVFCIEQAWVEFRRAKTLTA